MKAERQLPTRAAKKGFEAAAPLLQERGAAVDAQDSGGRTALMRVTDAEDHATAPRRLEWDAAVEAVDEDGWTLLMWAAGEGREAVVGLVCGGGRRGDG
jgi:ankyrin repeat protein